MQKRDSSFSVGFSNNARYMLENFVLRPDTSDVSLLADAMRPRGTEQGQVGRRCDAAEKDPFRWAPNPPIAACSFVSPAPAPETGTTTWSLGRSRGQITLEPDRECNVHACSPNSHAHGRRFTV